MKTQKQLYKLTKYLVSVIPCKFINITTGFPVYKQKKSQKDCSCNLYMH